MQHTTLSKEQFSVLSAIEHAGRVQNSGDPIKLAQLSEEKFSEIANELATLGLMADGQITEAGYAALEPYRVKRAVFIAAGFGSRLVPITLNTPKPLVRVNGTRMIDTLLNAVVAAGIEEIYVVRGYLGEQFDQLLYKYPNIRFIENTLYNQANNISSAYLARDVLANAYVFEADLVLYNPSLIRRYQYTSNYLGVPVKESDDWVLVTDENGRVIKLGVGGTDCFHLYGVSYWTEADGTRLKEDLVKVFEQPDGKQLYWDQVPLDRYIDNYHVEVRSCTFDDIIEIDSFADLKKLDEAYR
ncbi:MAG: phosphocholine cytidylyltransferase family protein [Clostridia bacterium]|nr:phosphocholine cytidylyltransferase family protein [Clostridia bacterium]